jgi:hypothetical protein
MLSSLLAVVPTSSTCQRIILLVTDWPSGPCYVVIDLASLCPQFLLSKLQARWLVARQFWLNRGLQIESMRILLN